MIVVLVFLVLTVTRSPAEQHIRINYRTCGAKYNLNETGTLYLNYYGSVLEPKITNPYQSEFQCVFDVENLEEDKEMCIQTEQVLSGEWCRLKFLWKGDSGDFVLFGLSTYWCDMFQYGRICLPVWRTRVLLETVNTMIQLQFSTQLKVPDTNIIYQRLDPTRSRYGQNLRQKLTVDIYIILTVLVFISGCVAVGLMMRHMKRRANIRRIMNTNIELDYLRQTNPALVPGDYSSTTQSTCGTNPAQIVDIGFTAQHRMYVTTSIPVPGVSSRSNILQQTFSYADLQKKHQDHAVPPPYLENPPPYTNPPRS